MPGPVEAPDDDLPPSDPPDYADRVPVEDPPTEPPSPDVSTHVQPPTVDDDTASPPVDASGDPIPADRLAQLTEQVSGLEAQLVHAREGTASLDKDRARLQRLIANIAGLAPGAGADAEPRNERDEQAFKRLLEVAPGLERLLDPKFTDTLDRLETTLSDMDSTNAATKAYYDRYGDDVMEKLAASYAELIYPDGDKSGKDLSPQARGYLAQNFLMWVDRDPKLTARYEGLDPSLSGEFMEHLGKTMFGNLARSTAAAQERRLTAVSHLPVQGGEGAPATKPTKKLNLQSEDDVMDKAASLAGLG